MNKTLVGLSLSISLVIPAMPVIAGDQAIRTVPEDEMQAVMSQPRVIPSTASVEGLFQALQADAEPVHVILIHGMRTQEEDWSKPLRDGLAKKLQLSSVDKEKNCQRTDIQVPGVSIPAVLRLCEYANQSGRVAKFYEVTWSPLTALVKLDVLAYDSEEEFQNKRELFNGKIKKEIINDGLADPILYSTHYRHAMQYPIQKIICTVAFGVQKQKSLCQLTERKTAPNKKVFIITHSLGSAIFYDSLHCLERPADLECQTAQVPKLAAQETRARRQAAQIIKDNTRTVFMLANQLPLLCLAERLPPKPNMPHDSRESLCGQRQVGATEEPKTTVVAVSDLNDLFTYPLMSQHLTRIRVNSIPINVYVELASWRKLPGVIADPVSAHKGHFTDGGVARLIACGLKEGTVADCE